MNGGNRRVIVNQKLSHAFGLTQLGDYIYWTDWQQHTINRVNKNTKANRKVIKSKLSNLMGIKALSLKEPLNGNLCSNNNGNCSQFCFYKPNGNYKCACETGITIIYTK